MAGLSGTLGAVPTLYNRTEWHALVVPTLPVDPFIMRDRPGLDFFLFSILVLGYDEHGYMLEYVSPGKRVYEFQRSVKALPKGPGVFTWKNFDDHFQGGH